ncbi:HIT-like protein [Collybia nuda]|uniref:HIT-like protein n=1 Tax=Collybia nuda TaxID=64659 RepID=A0A9P5XTQ4_9AGAR|nr:HIT-like protein [Collybia nuda]
MFGFFMSLFSCVGSTQTSDDGHFSLMKSCTFCHVSKPNGFRIVWEDDTFCAFIDHKPAAEHHLLIIPKIHITSVRSLTKKDTIMVQSMERIGHDILDGLSVSPSARRMGFHIPPFNSVDHLHLHVHGLPYASPFREAKYMISKDSHGNEKGYGWFAEVGQVIRILEKGGRVRVSPC